MSDAVRDRTGQDQATGPAIRTEGLTRTFGDVEALAGLDLEVGRGEVVALLGPNGAGKTTTIRILVTLLAPTSGRAQVLGHDVVTDAREVRGLIGVTLQEPAFDPMMTGRELARLHAAMYGLGKDGVGRGNDLLVELGLEEAADRKVMTYSGGMRRRLDLALSLLHQPRILILDEPSAGLDPASRMVIWDKIRQLRETGASVLLTTHYLEEADQLADRVSIVDHGKVVAEGTPADLKASFGRPRLQVSFEGADVEAVQDLLRAWGDVHLVGEGDGRSATVSVETDPSSVADVLRALQEHGAQVQGVDVLRPTLEDVFIAKTGRRLEGAAMGTRG